jgi:alpha-galactosidase
LRPVSQATPQQVWFSADRAGGYTVALFNLTAGSATVTAGWTDLGIAPTRAAAVRDLWTHTDLGTFTGGFSATVPGHGARLLHVPPVRHR